MPQALATDPVAAAAREGLACPQKSLPPWLFYDEAGSNLFEQITTLPEYYLTRTERKLLERHDEEIVYACGELTVVELGAGTATKTGILLQAASNTQRGVLYQPIDISPTALEAARTELEAHLPGVTVCPQVANYITEPYRIEREPGRTVLALYIGSSIGNFSPAEANSILTNLRRQLQPGDYLLLGTDLAPGPAKSVAALLAAYDDAQGVTAAFNRNILTHLNRELGADFNPSDFSHQARWNAAESRIEMHLLAKRAHSVQIPANASGPAQRIEFAAGESIHTENSYKFTQESIAHLLTPAGFRPLYYFNDPDQLYALTLAETIT